MPIATKMRIRLLVYLREEGKRHRSKAKRVKREQEIRLAENMMLK